MRKLLLLYICLWLRAIKLWKFKWLNSSFYILDSASTGFSYSDSNPYFDFTTLGCVSLIECKGQFYTPNKPLGKIISPLGQTLQCTRNCIRFGDTQRLRHNLILAFKSRMMNLSSFARDIPNFSNEKSCFLERPQVWANGMVGHLLWRNFGLDWSHAWKYAIGSHQSVYWPHTK